MAEKLRRQPDQQSELEPRVKISEQQSKEARARFEADHKDILKHIAEKINRDSELEFSGDGGKVEKWRVLEAHKDLLLLSRGAKQKLVSREEAVLQNRSTEFIPLLNERWDSVLVTTETISDPKHKAKALKLLTTHKAEIMRVAALTVSADEHAELAPALHKAMFDVIEDHADATAAKKLEMAIDANDALLNMRFASIDSTVDEVPVDIGEDEVTDSLHNAQTGPIIKPNALPLALAKAESAAIDVPPQALAPARGEVSVYAALGMLGAFDIKQMDSADIEVHLAQLAELRDKIEREDSSMARSFAILDIQKQQQALRSEQSLGVVQEMLKELQAKKPAEKKRGRPVDVGNLILKVKLKAKELQMANLSPGDAKWSVKTQEAWELEKRLLAATGSTEELRPENFSDLYAFYTEALRNGDTTKNEAIAALEDLGRNANTLSGRDAEGLRILFDELTFIDGVGDNLNDELEIINESVPTPVEVTDYDDEDEVGIIADEDLEDDDFVGSSLDDELEISDGMTHVSKKHGKYRPVPLNAQRMAAESYSGKESVNFLANREAPVQEVTAEEKKSGDELAEQLAERDNNRFLRPNLTPESQGRDFTEEGWMQEGDNGDFESPYAPTATMKEERSNPNALYGNISVETPRTDNEPFRRVAARFGGAKEFLRMYNDLNKEGRAPFDLQELIDAKKFKKFSQDDYVTAFSEAAGAPIENEEQTATPFEQVAEAFAGEKNFEAIYKELQNADMDPYDLEELKRAPAFKGKGTAKDVVDTINKAIKELEKSKNGDSLLRAPTPYEQIAEELGGVDILEDMYSSLTKNDGEPPYTLDELKAMKKPTLLQRFIPWGNPIDKAVADVQKFMAAAEKRKAKGVRRSDTFSGRRGGRPKL